MTYGPSINRKKQKHKKQKMDIMNWPVLKWVSNINLYHLWHTRNRKRSKRFKTKKGIEGKKKRGQKAQAMCLHFT